MASEVGSLFRGGTTATAIVLLECTASLRRGLGSRERSPRYLAGRGGLSHLRAQCKQRNCCATHVAFYLPLPLSLRLRLPLALRVTFADGRKAARCFSSETRSRISRRRVVSTQRFDLRGRITCSMLAGLSNGWRGLLRRRDVCPCVSLSPFLRLWDCIRVPPYLTSRFLGNDTVRPHLPGSAELLPGLAGMVVLCLALAREFLLFVAPSLPVCVDS